MSTHRGNAITGDGVTAASALCRALSGHMNGNLTIEIGPPGYDAERGVLRLPGIPTMDVPPEQLTLLRAALAHGAGLRGLGTPKRPAEWKGAKEAEGVLFDALNTVRAHRWIGEEYPGAAYNLEHAMAHDAKELKDGAGMFEASASMLGTLLQHVLSKSLTIDEAKAVAPQLAPWLEKIEDLIPTLDTSTEDACRASAERLWTRLRLPPPQKQRQPQEGDGPVGDPPPEGEEGEQQGGGGTGNPPQNQQSGRGKGSGKPQEQQQNGSGKPQNQTPKGQGPKQQQQQPSTAPQAEQPQLKARAGTDHDTTANWVKQSAQSLLGSGTSHGPMTSYTYRMDQDRVSVLGNAGRSQLPADLRGPAQRLELSLRQLLTLPSRAWVKRQVKGRFDPSRIVPLIEGKDTVFRRRKKLDGIDVAVSISVDESGSMGCWLGTVRALLATFNQALGGLDIPFEVLGWTDGNAITGDTRGLYRLSTLNHRVFKTFSDPALAPETFAKLTQVAAMGGTPSAEGLQFALDRLARRPEPHKMLFFVTDGQPALHANGSHEVHHAYLRDLIKRAEKHGIEVIGVGLGEELKQFIPHSINVRSADAAALRTTLGDELLSNVRRHRAEWRRKTA